MDFSLYSRAIVNRKFTLVQMAICAALLSACGDDGDGKVPPPPEEMPFSTGGIWNGSVVGTIDPNPADTAVSPTAAIDLNDDEVVIFATEVDKLGISQFRLVSERALQAVGEIELTPDETNPNQVNLKGNFTAFAPDGYFFSFGAETAECTLEGFGIETLGEDSMAVRSIDINYECRDKDDLVTASGRLLADYNAALYEQPSSIFRLAGKAGDSESWCGLDFSTTNNNVVLALDIFNDGTQGIVNGSNIEGCGYTGAIDIIDPAFNLYGITLTASACEFLDGAYSGLATYMAGADGSPDEFIYQIDNGSTITTQPVYRSACVVD